MGRFCKWGPKIIKKRVSIREIKVNTVEVNVIFRFSVVVANYRKRLGAV